MVVDTGEVFETLRDAARYAQTTDATLRRYILQKRPWGELTYKYLFTTAQNAQY